jgi:hypothetical protein
MSQPRSTPTPNEVEASVVAASDAATVALESDPAAMDEIAAILTRYRHEEEA